MATVFISGHLDLTPEEFLEHYAPQLDNYIAGGFLFVVGDARGTDDMAQRYLWHSWVDNRITVYHMFDAPRHCVSKRVKLVGGFESDSARDTAMTDASDFDLARRAKKNKGVS